MKVNNINSQQQNKQSFGQLRLKRADELEQCIKKVFGSDEKGYKNYIKLRNQVKARHSSNSDYDIWLFANKDTKKDVFEAMVIYKPLNTMVGWIRSTDNPYKKMLSKKNVLTKMLKNIDAACPTKPFCI